MTTATPSAQAVGSAIAKLVNEAIKDSEIPINRVATQSGIARTTLKRKCITGDFSVVELIALSRVLGKADDYFLKVEL